MHINNDPDGTPEIRESLVPPARSAGMQIINVTCDEPGTQVCDKVRVSITALVPFLPRPGAIMWPEDATKYQVRQVFFKENGSKDARGKAECILLVPQVLAIRES